MASPTPGFTPTNPRRRRVHTETKAAYKTTELIVYVVSVIAVLIASAVVDSDEDGSAFGARQAWLYVTLLSIAYIVSRGLAKSGSRESYDDDDNDEQFPRRS